MKQYLEIESNDLVFDDRLRNAMSAAVREAERHLGTAIAGAVWHQWTEWEAAKTGRYALMARPVTENSRVSGVAAIYADGSTSSVSEWGLDVSRQAIVIDDGVLQALISAAGEYPTSIRTVYGTEDTLADDADIEDAVHRLAALRFLCTFDKSQPDTMPMIETFKAARFGGAATW